MVEIAVKTGVILYSGAKSANIMLKKAFFNPKIAPLPLQSALRGDPSLKYFRVLRNLSVYHSPLFTSQQLIQTFEDDVHFIIQNKKHRTHVNMLMAEGALSCFIDDITVRKQIIACHATQIAQLKPDSTYSKWRFNQYMVEVIIEDLESSMIMSSDIKINTPQRIFLSKLRVTEPLLMDTHSLATKHFVINEIQNEILACDFESSQALMFQDQGLLTQIKL